MKWSSRGKMCLTGFRELPWAIDVDASHSSTTNPWQPKEVKHRNVKHKIGSSEFLGRRRAVSGRRFPQGAACQIWPRTANWDAWSYAVARIQVQNVHSVKWKVSFRKRWLTFLSYLGEVLEDLVWSTCRCVLHQFWYRHLKWIPVS